MGKLAKQFFELVKKERKQISRFGVSEIGIFGSSLRGEETKTSDVDVLVSFKEKSFDNYMDLKMFLEKGLNRKVDLVIKDAIKPALKDIILNEVKYAA